MSTSRARAEGHRSTALRWATQGRAGGRRGAAHRLIAGQRITVLSEAHLCRSTLRPGSSRWTFYYCEACRPHVVLLNRRAGRCVVPIGPHSIVNGVFHTAGDGPDVDAQAFAFADQLSTLFQNRTTLQELTVQRTRTRLKDIRIDTHAVVVHDYFDLCHHEAWDAERGFADFVLSIGEATG